MPLLLGFALIAVFIYLAENIGTLTATWVYPDQADGWRPVTPAKYGSWFLLMLVSFVLVTLVHRPPGQDRLIDSNPVGTPLGPPWRTCKRPRPPLGGRVRPFAYPGFAPTPGVFRSRP